MNCEKQFLIRKIVKSTKTKDGEGLLDWWRTKINLFLPSSQRVMGNRELAQIFKKFIKQGMLKREVVGRWTYYLRGVK